MTAPGGDTKGNPFYEVFGIWRHWRYSKEKMNDLIQKGLVVQTSEGNVPRKKLYLDEGQGVPIQSLWDDVSALSSQSGERVDYPTQKPESLLARIINTSTNVNDLIFDCFMGSGTTQAVALKLGRRFIGADINLGAVQTTTKRLITVAEELYEANTNSKLNFQANETKIDKFYTGFQTYNVNHYDFFRNELEAKDLLIKALEIQPVVNSSLYDGEKDGRMVKIMPINRIATRADLNELITGFSQTTFEKRQSENPNKPVEYITLVCMGHEPDLSAQLQNEMKPYKIDVEVVDILRDESKLEFKRDSEAEIFRENGKIIIKQFYPMNLLQKLSLDKQNVEDWKELVESVMIDFNFDGAIFEPKLVNIPEGNELVTGKYQIPADAGTIRVKITDLLSESLEVTIK
jgi:site-specific DNA-methyltransferase (adenine-specific)/adenine-specific DNA-methyltransferase